MLKSRVHNHLTFFSLFKKYKTSKEVTALNFPASRFHCSLVKPACSSICPRAFLLAAFSLPLIKIFAEQPCLCLAETNKIISIALLGSSIQSRIWDPKTKRSFCWHFAVIKDPRVFQRGTSLDEKEIPANFRIVEGFFVFFSPLPPALSSLFFSFLLNLFLH